MSNLLEIRNVTKVYQRGLLSSHAKIALKEFSLTLKEDEPTIMTVAGESGSGKTTLAMLLLGFITPTTGEILYRGKNITTLRGKERIAYRREVQAVFQDPFAVFNPFYTVDHLLTVPIKQFKLARSGREARAKMDEALTTVGLRPEDVLGRFPHQLSGGQRQRVGVARALAARPRVLLLDEPFGALDPITRVGLQDKLRRIHLELGLTSLLVTHDMVEALVMADRIAVMLRGELRQLATPAELFAAPADEYVARLVAMARTQGEQLRALGGAR